MVARKSLRKTRRYRVDAGQRRIPVTRDCDRLFSLAVRERDGWTCQRCGVVFEGEQRSQLTCSHWFPVRYTSVRYFPDNCVALCVTCHTAPLTGWEYQKQRAYRAFMVKRLGKRRFCALLRRARNATYSLELAKVEFMDLRREGKLLCTTEEL